MRMDYISKKTRTISSMCQDVAQVLFASVLIEPTINKTATSFTTIIGIILTTLAYLLGLKLATNDSKNDRTNH